MTKPRETKTDAGKIIYDLGGPAAVGAVIGARMQAVYQMGRRGSFPGAYWAKLIALAKSAKVKGVTLDSLYDMHTAAMKKNRQRAL